VDEFPEREFNITKRLAQTINGRKEGIHIYGSDWQQFAKDVSLSPARTVKRVVEMCQLVAEKADEAKNLIAASPAGPHQILDEVVLAVKKRCRRIRNQLSKVDKIPDESAMVRG
jgi:hypothetical protein